VGGREARHFVVDEPDRDRRIDHVDIAERGRLPLPPNDPDRAVLAQGPLEVVEPTEVSDRLGPVHDDVGVGRGDVTGPEVGHIGGALGEERPEDGVVHVGDRDPGAGPDAELVEEGSRVHAFHRRYRATVTSDGPLLVFGPRSPTYDFGPGHPLTPLRFGPGIDLLQAVGAEPGLAPEPAPDEALLACHEPAYVATVRRLSLDPDGPEERGFGRYGDDPPFAGMHEAAASVAGGSLAAMLAILEGRVEHAFHPGGGLHHANRGNASGFCIYDDPALAIALARSAGLRVLYVDLDVHHGDGVEAIHAADPGVLTVSFHESGRTLFPGTGGVGEAPWGFAPGTVVNVPFEAYTGETVWLDAVEAIVPRLAERFRPDVVVSQHGADSHAWDPLAHLRVTTTAMGAAARIVDRVAHEHASGRWLATGGGGYDVYRVVPRAWSLVWLAGAHRDAPEETPVEWRERWADDAERYGMPGMPERFEDAPNAGRDPESIQLAAEELSRRTVARVLASIG